MSHRHHHHHPEKIYKSTLLNETKRVELYRVSEETKKRVEEESKAIRDAMSEANRLSRIQVKKNEHKKIKQNELERKKMIAKWVEMSKNSPFHQDIAGIEDNRLKRKEEREYRKRVDDDRNALIDGMIGTCKYEIATKERSKIFSEPSTHLALSLRRCAKDKDIIREERNTLTQLIDQQFTEMQHKFPNVDFGMKFSDDDRSNKLPPLSSSLKTPKLATKSSDNSETPKPKKSVQLSQSSIDGSITSGSGSMYHSPQLNPESFGFELDEAFNR